MGDERRNSQDIHPNPPDLRPPGSLPESDVSTSGHRLGVAIGLVVLLVAAAAVVILLPQLSQQGQEQPATVSSRPDQQAVPPVPVAVDSEARLRAEHGLRDFLRLRARLELQGAAVWGEPEWSTAEAEVKQGDRLFVQNEFDAADTAYQGAIERLKRLEMSREQRLAKALREGDEALAADQAAEAVTQFERALAISDQNTQAIRGLARAMAREQVLDLMEIGQQAEARGDLAAARTAYAQAAQLDADYQQALLAQQRVSEQIENAAFLEAMNDAIQALEARRYGASQQALEIAETLKPEDDAVRDLRLQLETARQRNTLAQWRRKAQEEVVAEDWQAALDTYSKALELDSAAAFAVAGASKARARLRLHRQIDHYLQDTERLLSEEPLANAEKVLAAAGTAPTAEPRLNEKLATLRDLVEQARTPAKVELLSDGETDVVIYHVGQRGRFLQQVLELRPGTYTVIGSRPGYRDVRQQFVVGLDSSPVTVTVRCEELL